MEARMRPFMPDSPPGDVEEMRDQIQKYKALLAIQDPDDEDFAPVRKKLAALEKSLNKATKDTPTTAISALELKVARKKYEESEEKRLKVAQTGAERAAERVTKLEKICQRQIQAWQKIEKPPNDLHCGPTIAELWRTGTPRCWPSST